MNTSKKDFTLIPSAGKAVRLFFNIFNEKFSKAYSVTDDKGVVTLLPEGSNWLKILYKNVVFEASELKNKIPGPVIGSQTDAERPDECKISTGSVWDNSGLIIEAGMPPKYSLFCVLVRGNEGSHGAKSEIWKSSEGEVVVFFTLRLFEACLTLMIVAHSHQKGLAPAKLGAKVVAACDLEQAGVDEDNWSIHGHSGLHFVAAYIYDITKREPEATILRHLPSMPHVFAMARRMDEVHMPKIKEKNKGVGQSSILNTIIRTCRLSKDEVDSISDECSRIRSHWKEPRPSAEELTKYFVCKLRMMEGT